MVKTYSVQCIFDWNKQTNKQTNKQSLCAAVQIMHVLFGCLPFTFAGESKEEEKFLAL